MSRLAEFEQFRARMNEKILAEGNRDTKRFFGLDSQIYEDGRLDRRTKEMMGLVASLVLRCDDCVSYHVIQCHELGVNLEEFYELFNVGMMAGGSIVIPHLRRAVELLDELEKKQPS